MMILCNMNCFAQRSFSQISEIAKQKLQGSVELVASANKSAKERVIRKTNSAGSASDLFYVFNGNKQGFVIVSADENAPAVLGYSDEGSFDPNNIPEGLATMLELYHDQLSLLKSKPDTQTFSGKGTYTPIAPMLNCHFYQAEPYNNLCPTIGGVRAVTGCVATGLAQVLYFWQAPKDSLRGTIQFGGNRNVYDNPEDFPVDYKLGGHYFDWKNILPRYVEGQYTPEQAYAVADLSLICGVVNNMIYGVKESSADLRSITKRLVENFGMTDRCSVLSSLACSASEWHDFVIEELQSGRPIYYSGQLPSDTNSGHCFVLDGLDIDGLVHVNWGWDGRSDGYFLLNILNPREQGIGGSSTGGGYGAWNQMVRGLCPKGMDEGVPYMLRLIGRSMVWMDPVGGKQQFVAPTNNEPYSFEVKNSKKLDISMTVFNVSTDFNGVLNAVILPFDMNGDTIKIFQQNDSVRGGPGEYGKILKLDLTGIPAGKYKIKFTTQDKRECQMQPLNFEYGFLDTLHLQVTDSGYIVSKITQECPIKCEFLNSPTSIHLLEGLDSMKVKITCRPDMDFSDKRLSMWLVAIKSKANFRKSTPANFFSLKRGDESINTYYLEESLAEVNSQVTKEESDLKPGDVLGLFMKSSTYDQVCSDTIKITILDSEIPTGKKPVELTIKGVKENYNEGDTIHYSLNIKGNTFISKNVCVLLKDSKNTTRMPSKNFRIDVKPDTDTDNNYYFISKILPAGTYSMSIVDYNSQKWAGDDYVYDDLSQTVQFTIGSPTGISNLNEENSCRKFVEGTYNLAGQRVNSDYKGIIIENGKRFLNK